MAFNAKPDKVPEFAVNDVTGPLYSQNNVVEPGTDQKNSGWLENQKPPRQYLNWLHRKTYQWVDYFNQFFSATHQLKINEIVEETASGGVKVTAVGGLILPAATSPAQTADGSMVWDSDSDLLTIGDGTGRKTMVDTSQAQTIAGVKTFSSIPVLPASDPTTDNQAARKAYVDTCVKLTGAQTIAGVKTFSSTIVGSINSIKETGSAGATVREKIIEIGDWNMYQAGGGSSSKSVAHGLTLANIRSVQVTIRNDSNEIMSLNYDNCGYWNTGTTNVYLSRVSSSIFDGTSFDATPFNRGWIIIKYVD